MAESYERSMRRKANRKALIIIVLSGLFGAYLYLSIPKPYKVTYDAVEYQCNNQKLEKRVKIVFDGYYYYKLIGIDRFEGDVVIGNKKLYRCSFRIDKNGEILSGFEAKSIDGSTYGMIFAKNRLRSVTILAHIDGQWSTKDGLVISAPCSSRAEAVDITNDLAVGMMKIRVK